MSHPPRRLTARCRAIMRLALLFGAWLASAVFELSNARAEDTGEAAQQFAGQIRPLLADYCEHCHGGNQPEGKLALDQFKDFSSIAQNTGRWRTIAERLRDGDMPPEGEDRPEPAQLEMLTAWIERQVAAAEKGQVRDPGRVTIRRLNRVEYDNTIRDLVGLDFHPASDFPADDVGYSFDNNGDVLSLPPLLMEKYLAAAHTIAEAAIVVHPGARLLLDVDLQHTPHDRSVTSFDESSVLFATNAELLVDLPVVPPDSYRFEVKAYGQQAGPEPARMELRIDGRSIGILDVAAVRRAPKTYEVVAHLDGGKHQLSIAFINDYYAADGPPGARDRNLFVDAVRFESRISADGSLPETHRRIIFRDPAAGDESATAREILQRFASRAYRRPAQSADVDRLMKLYDLARGQGDNFAEATRVGVAAALVSPRFLYRLELDPAAGQTEPSDQKLSVRALGDYDVASRLSYFLWNSMPDDELFAAAAAGRLTDPAQVAIQARRMLTDPRSRSFIESFAGQWLELRRLGELTPSRKKFPDFNKQLAAAMRQETERFFAAVVDEDRSVLDFLDGPFTFVNESLARHYKIDGVEGPDFRRVELDGIRRGGLLTQASILTLTSNPNRTSPVKRGKWVLDNLLGAAPPPPPPDVPALPESKGDTLVTGSLRQRFEQHTANAGCASCHSRMDPIGFGLENYDAVGVWRGEEAGTPVDASGTVLGQAFSGPAELKQRLKSKPVKFTRCLAEKLLIYALGRGLESYDRSALAEIVSRTTAADYRFSGLLEAIVQSDPFLKCRTTGQAP